MPLGAPARPWEPPLPRKDTALTPAHPAQPVHGSRCQADWTGVGLLKELGCPTVAELEFSAQALTARRPGLCALRPIGVSRAGRPLRPLSVGHARPAVLVVAGAHANEPTGGSTVLALAERVVRERELRDQIEHQVRTVPAAASHARGDVPC
jgi:hypothetical protein